MTTDSPHDTAPRHYDLLVVGSGIAGLYAAIRAQEHGASVLLVTKGAIEEASTRWAQGGIAAAVGHGDTPEAHLRDTIEAGAGLVDEAAARILVEGAADRIADLVRYGVQFDASDGAGSALGINGWRVPLRADTLDLVLDDIGICPALPAPGEKCGELTLTRAAVPSLGGRGIALLVLCLLLAGEWRLRILRM